MNLVWSAHSWALYLVTDYTESQVSFFLFFLNKFLTVEDRKKMRVWLVCREYEVIALKNSFYLSQSKGNSLTHRIPLLY